MLEEDALEVSLSTLDLPLLDVTELFENCSPSSGCHSASQWPIEASNNNVICKSPIIAAASATFKKNAGLQNYRDRIGSLLFLISLHNNGQKNAIKRNSGMALGL